MTVSRRIWAAKELATTRVLPAPPAVAAQAEPCGDSGRVKKTACGDCAACRIS